MSFFPGFLSFAAVALSAVALSSCGGGGGGASGVSGGGVISPSPAPAPRPVNTRTLAVPSADDAPAERVSTLFASYDDLGGKPAEAARMSPRSGSVTQSSNGDGVTADSVSVSVAGGTVTVTKNGNLLGAATLGLTSEEIKSLFDISLDGNALKFLYFHTASLGGTYDKFAAWGSWLEVPLNADVAPTVGAFADSNSYFPQAELRGVTGKADYRGTASGLYLKRGDGESPTVRVLDVYGFRLTADFGDALTLGTIGGTLSARRNGVGDITLTLGDARIGSGKSGFFTGDTTGGIGGSALSGKWGGQFLSYPNRRFGFRPDGVIGTFGGATADGSESIIGSFQTVKPTIPAASLQVRKERLTGMGSKEVYFCNSGHKEGCPDNDDAQINNIHWITYVTGSSFSTVNYIIVPIVPAMTYIQNSNIDSMPRALSYFDLAGHHQTVSMRQKTDNNGAYENKIIYEILNGELEVTFGQVDADSEETPFIEGREEYTDYLVYGDWIYTNPQGGVSFGVFAGGTPTSSIPFLAPLTGTATYEGRVDGLYASPDTVGVIDFTGSSTLTADFGAADTLGTIGGSVSSTGVIEGQTARWNLDSTEIGSGGEYRSFRGGVSGTVDGVSYSGRWGGQFFSEDNGYPGAVAGTFGASNPEGTHGVAGTFGAWKQ